MAQSLQVPAQIQQKVFIQMLNLISEK